MDAITGMNSESKETNEGEVTFDVRFHMVTKEKERIKVIVNIEAQRKYYVGYHFEPRAVVYCARMISEQIDREFTTDDYDYLSISFIRLSKGSMEDSKNKLIHMLSTLFSEQLNAEQKKKILEREHQMEMTRKLEGRIHTMCNVGAGLWERAEEQGDKQRLMKQVKKKLEKNKSVEQIADELEETVPVIQEIIKELKK